MAVSHVNTQTATTGNGTSVTATKPTGTASGDLLLAFFVSNSQDATAPAGWTEIVDQVVEVFRAQVFYKVAGGSEPANYAFSVGAAAPLVLSVSCFRGIDTTDPIDISPVVETALTHSEGYTTPSVTGGSSGRLLYFRAVRFAGSTPPTFTASGIPELADVGVFSGGSVSYSQAYYTSTSDYTTSGSQGGASITCSGSESHNIVLTMGIRASGVPGTMEATLPVPTMSADGSWAIPATMAASLPLPTMTASAFAGDNEGTLSASVPITVSLAGNTPVRGTLDAVVTPSFSGIGETRHFAENVVNVERDERWFVITQDGYRLGTRNQAITLLRIELPLPDIAINVFHITIGPTADVQATAFDPSVQISFSAGTATANVTG